MTIENFEPETTDATAAETAGSGTDFETEIPEETPSERSFSQSEVNRIVEERLARERRSYERQAQPEPQETRGDPLAERVALLDLQYRTDKMRTQYPDFAENEADILETALQLAENASPEWLRRNDILEVARRFHLYPKLSQIDVKKVEEAAYKRGKSEGAQEYMGKKTAQIAGAPQIEGKGGGAPVGVRSPDPKDEKANRQWAVEHLRNS